MVQVVNSHVNATMNYCFTAVRTVNNDNINAIAGSFLSFDTFNKTTADDVMTRNDVVVWLIKEEDEIEEMFTVVKEYKGKKAPNVVAITPCDVQKYKKHQVSKDKTNGSEKDNVGLVAPTPISA